LLVVENDDELRACMVIALESKGYLVATAANGSAALLALEAMAAAPSVLLLDMRMPIMSGGELLEALMIHPRFASVPVVVISSESARPAGARLVFQKPIELETLLDAVAEVCAESTHRAA
jgi:CheY-like chemotaxis protein